jgi:dTDP-glucose 4,6-dehydratase
VTAEPATTPVDRLPPSPRLLVTGGAGFIGSAFVRAILGRHDDTRITVLDKLTYAGNRGNLAAVEADPDQARRFRFVVGDIADPAMVGPLVDGADAVVNFAAESHVDRSILDPEAFLRTGVIGVHVLLEAVRRQDRPVRFLQVSTDEVYGSLEPDDPHWTESSPIAPRSPYSAAKAAGEQLVRSYVVTFELDALITRGSNTYGPYQHPEKLIPLFISNAMDDEQLPMYGDGMQRRDWLFVDDHAGAVEYVLHHGASGEAYNVPGAAELPNRDVIAALLDRLGKPWSLVRSVADRPGHDRRYAMDGSKLNALGWRNHVEFADGIATTVDWFRANEAWWRAIRSGEWDAYYARQYAARLAGGIGVADVGADAVAGHSSAGLAMADAAAADYASAAEAAAAAQSDEPGPELG